MKTIRETTTFRKWFQKLKDRRAKGAITERLFRLKNGLTGDAKPVGQGVSELRIPYGPGYRVYFRQRGEELIILLCGGDKSTQAADIKKAKEIDKTLSH